MKTKFIFLSVIISSIPFFTSCVKHGVPLCGTPGDSTVTTIKVFATGLNNPRGLKFGPDGNLYVAEGGCGGSDSTTTCEQVPAPVGPYKGSDTGSYISKIDENGNRTIFVDHIPSSQTSALQGNLTSGVGDISFVGNTMYAVLAGAGCSHGVPDIPNGVIRINPNRSWTMIANLSEFQMTHPVQHPFAGDFEPDGTWYSMIAVGDDLYAVEPNHGELDKISANGSISRIIDISAFEGHIVPTAETFHDGNFYVGNLNTFPINEGSSNIYKITPQGQISVFATGFTTVTGVLFDNHNRMYVLENTTNNQFPTPGTGEIVRVDPSGDREIIASGLDLPTAMTFGPDGKLYVSNWGFGPPPVGQGEILQIGFKCEEVQSDAVGKP